MSFDTLISKIISMKNPTVAGLDPKLEYVPEYLRRSFLEEDGETLKAASKAIYRYITLMKCAGMKNYVRSSIFQ